MLDHHRRDDRQLFDLMADRVADREQLPRSEGVTAPTALRPVLDHLIHGRERQELTAVTLMPGLRALRTPGRVLPPLGLLARRIDTRRAGRITRAAIQPTLKLSDPLILASDMRLKLLDPATHRQQHLNDGLTTLVIDRLRLNALHAQEFDAPGLCPPTQLNGYKRC
jgi:hypothetical protein